VSELRTYVDNGSEVVSQELDLLRTQWEGAAAQRGKFPENSLGGLALSGGGVRSASFAFGVMQALAECKADAVTRTDPGHPSLLQRLQYLSTVSGGGFAGTAVTRTVNSKSTQYDLAEKFPFRSFESAEPDKPDKKEKTPPSKSLMPVVRYKASYLDMESGGTRLTAVAVVVRTVFLTSLIYLLGCAAMIGIAFPVMLHPRIESLTILGIHPNGASMLALALLVYLLLDWLVYSMKSGFSPAKRLPWTNRKAEELHGSDVAFAALMLAGIGLVGYFPTFGGPSTFDFTPSIALALGSIGALGGLIAQFKTLFGRLSDKRMLPAIFLWVSGIALIVALLIGGRELALAWHDVASYGEVWKDLWYWLWIAALLGTFLVLGKYGNVNYIGLHRFYRDRLMLTFLDYPHLNANQNFADSLKLDEMADVSKGLYPLINANVVLVNSDEAKFKVRGGDSYLLSPLFTGSAATGWARTKFRDETPEEKQLRESMFGQPGASLPPKRIADPGLASISLASAMAVSGAALNPATGSDGEGPTRSGMLPIILSLLGIRLGYWQPNPRQLGAKPETFARPNFLVPGLLYGVLQQGHTELSNWIEITDGGHFENMGLYELFRRKVRLIIVADGSTDPDFSMSSFASAYERARNDFGVEIDIASYPANFNDMMPDSARPNSSIKRRYRLAEHGFAIGVFTYPEDRAEPGEPSSVGYIFYVNTVLTENLKSNLYSYKAEHPQFPDEPLSDQFFNEKQFDAYCQLGRELTEQMINYARGYAELAAALGLKRARNFKYWSKVKESGSDSPEQFIGAKLDGLREAIHAAKP
jgi:hypothetical protein